MRSIEKLTRLLVYVLRALDRQGVLGKAFHELDSDTTQILQRAQMTFAIERADALLREYPDYVAAGADEYGQAIKERMKDVADSRWQYLSPAEAVSLYLRVVRGDLTLVDLELELERRAAESWRRARIPSHVK
ncbi:MAG: hypothetical protein IT462_03705 [Planctomycetes bacterium]|nr:hypothetical protein [Planctomycetota bacterium]